LAGGGEMGERTREHDWASTPVGPLAAWPQALKTAVGICLGSRYPMVMWWDRKSYTQFYNDAYISFLGDAKHPMYLGRSARECWSEIWQVIEPMLESVFDTGEPIWREDLQLVLNRHLPREEGYFTFSYGPIRADDGSIGGLFCACNETTARVIGERRLRTLRDLNRVAAEARTVKAACEVAATILAGNPGDIPFALIYLLNEEGTVAELMATTALSPDSPAAPTAIRLGETPTATTWPLASVIESGVAQLVRDLALRFGPVPGGLWPEPAESALIVPIAAPGHAQPAGFLVAGISPRRLVDADYRSFLDLVAGHVGTSIVNARAYDQERRRAEALAEIDRAKTVFFSNVSHEFRTPLTLMLGPLEESAANPEIPVPVRAQLELAHRNALRLLRLVNTLLDFSRIEAGRAQACFEPTDLGALTADLASIFRSAMEQAGLALLVECDRLEEPVFVDRAMWEQIVLNLLSNAVKFTLQGAVTIRLTRVGEDAVLEVRDTGVGIPERELPRLFERFHRIEGSAGRTQEGTGIGLALVHELVKLHGGSIRAASTLGSGTTFAVRLPLGSAHLPAAHLGSGRPPVSPADHAAAFVHEARRWTSAGTTASSSLPISSDGIASDRAGPAADRAKARVLLADDNADMRDYIRGMLASAYVIEAVADGEQALAAARRHPPDLVLSDIMMPRVDGLALLKTLRADPELRDIPVILLSARAGEEPRVAGLEAGADDYLIKPFSARELQARVGGQLALRRLREESRRALSDSEKRIRELFRQAPGFMCILRGPDHVIEFANDSYQLLVGDRELLGRPVRAAFPEVEGQGFFELLDRVYRSGEAITGSDTALQLRRGPQDPLESHFVDFVYQPIKDAAGCVSGIFVEGFDVTARVLAQRELRRSEDLRQLALDAARMGTFTWYPGQDRHESDARTLALFGIEDGKLITLAAVMDLIDPQDRARYSRSIARALDPGGDGILHEDIRITRPDDGSQRWIAISAQVFFDAERRRAVRMIGTTMDVTERKRVEEALRLADLQKDEFLAMLAHELRNPLAPITTASTLLSRTLAREDRAQIAIETIKRQTHQLTRLVDDLLDVSRITRGRILLRRQPIDLASAIAQAVETVEAQLREKQHSIAVTASSYLPLYVNGDPTRIVQCIGNVLANAAKYTDPGGAIRVQVRSEGSMALIEVSDNGMGISPDLLPHIFDLFVQGDRTLDRAQGGLGIGLSVVKRLVEMHEGEISAQSAGLGQGATFEIRLPLVARPQLLTPDATSISAPSRSVLVVDDNADAATTLAALLDTMGHETRVAFSGKEALEQLQTFAPQVVLLDIGLPTMNGYELAQRLRRDDKLKGVRLVALTGYGQAEDRQRALAEGFEEHLVKPVDWQTLERVLAAN